MRYKVEYYNKHRKKSWSPLILHKDTVCGFWWFGHRYATERDRFGNYFYGAYPRGYLDRMRLLFKDEFESGKILHLFSGTIKGKRNEVTFDINPKLKSDVCGNAEEVDRFFGREFDLILADPPYDENYKKYGTKPISRKRVISSCSKILNSGGYLVWLDTLVPQWLNADGWKYKGNIGIQQSTNHKTRAVTILRMENRI